MPCVTNDLLHSYRLYEYFIRSTGGGSKYFFLGGTRGAGGLAVIQGHLNRRCLLL